MCGVALRADCSGSLYWPEQGLLVVADLHLEKGSSFARRGMLLPPYDTGETLARLARLVAHYAPRMVVALGDNFHDGDGPARLSAFRHEAEKAGFRSDWDVHELLTNPEHVQTLGEVAQRAKEAIVDYSELSDVERRVGGWIAANQPVRALETTREEAERLGAMALFG